MDATSKCKRDTVWGPKISSSTEKGNQNFHFINVKVKTKVEPPRLNELWLGSEAMPWNLAPDGLARR